MTGSILQINVSPGGVPKRPIAEATVIPAGIVGDSWAHPDIHGGPRQALLLIAAESIEELTALGFPLFFGALGENLTTRGLDRREMRFGQRYRIGDVLIELDENARALLDAGCVWSRYSSRRVRRAGESGRCVFAALGAQRILRGGAARWRDPAG